MEISERKVIQKAVNMRCHCPMEAPKMHRSDAFCDPRCVTPCKGTHDSRWPAYETQARSPEAPRILQLDCATCFGKFRTPILLADLCLLSQNVRRFGPTMIDGRWLVGQHVGLESEIISHASALISLASALISPVSGLASCMTF